MTTPLSLGELRLLEDYVARGAKHVDITTFRSVLAAAITANERARAAEERAHECRVREDAAWALLAANLTPEPSP